MKIFQELLRRGVIKHVINDVASHLKESRVIYCGFDPTSNSLTVGHLMAIVTLEKLAEAGHKIVIVIGGITGRVGDPSGKKSERPIQDLETINNNCKSLEAILRHCIKSPNIEIVNNEDWLADIKLVDLLEVTGRHFSINEMIKRDCVADRLENGLTFTEFTYMLLQAQDFYSLNRSHNVTVQIGGSDQFGNILSGIDLAKKADKKELFGFTFPLLTNSDGTKFGKTESGAVWLSADKTLPYEFYQFWINREDSEVEFLLETLTTLTEIDICQILKDRLEYPNKRIPQKILAFELTERVHSTKVAIDCAHISNILFSAPEELKEEDMRTLWNCIPSFTVENGINPRDLVVRTNLADSNRKANELINSGAISVTQRGNFLLVKKGKKHFSLAEIA